MNGVRIAAPVISTDGQQATLSSMIEIDGQEQSVFYRWSEGPLWPGTEGFVPVALLAAMKLGVPLRIDGPVSERLLAALPEFQAIMHTWYNEFQVIPIEATPCVPSSPAAPGVACFFSGGIDSFYTALKHKSEITHLVFVHGADIGLGQTKLDSTVTAAMRQAAAELGKPLVEMWTNARSVLDAYGHWDYHMHGAAMAGIALSQGMVGKVYLAGAHSYAQLVPLGSHPLTNRLWSTEQVQLVTDGCEATRWEKMESICGNETVQRYLRVCWRNPDDSYNCQICNKCLPARGFIRAAGLQDRFRTFTPLNDLDELRRGASDAHMRIFLERLLNHLVVYHIEADVTPVLRAALGDGEAADGPSAEERIARLQKRVGVLEAQVQGMTASRSWRITAPLRRAAGMGRRGKR